MPATNPEAEFRRRALDIIANDGEAVRMRLDKTEQTVARSADSIDQLTTAIVNQSGNVDRLERGISQMVAEMSSQRETINNLIKLATALVNERAS